MILKETHDGPTPNGGVRSEAHYFDEADNPCDKANAYKVIIYEFDQHGKEIGWTIGFTNNKLDSQRT